jgi:hypothetical protein
MEKWRVRGQKGDDETFYGLYDAWLIYCILFLKEFGMRSGWPSCAWLADCKWKGVWEFQLVNYGVDEVQGIANGMRF